MSMDEIKTPQVQGPDAQASESSQGVGTEAPPWFEQILKEYRSRAAHQFLIHFNIHDYVLCPDTVLFPYADGSVPIKEYIQMQLASRLGKTKPCLIVKYSLSGGLEFSTWPLTPEAMAGLQDNQAMGHLFAFREEDESTATEALKDGHKAFQRAQSQGRGRGRQQLTQNPHEALPAIERALHQGETRLLVLLDYVEKMAPAGAQDRESLRCVELFQRWAMDEQIARYGHMIVLFAREHGQVHHSVYGANSACAEVQVPLPGPQERVRFIEYLLSRPELAELPLTLSAQELASFTIGFSLRDIMNLIREAMANQAPLDLGLVTERKKEIIRLESHGLLEVVETRLDLSSIGGLEHVKSYLQEKIMAIRAYLRLNAEANLNPEQARSETLQAQLQRSLNQVPKGIILAGPPGTGKTILAEALANESQINMVKLRDIHSMWLGESERNLTKVLDLLVALEPVLVFVDEIDQAFGSRGQGASSSGGAQETQSRIFGKLLEFMGNDRHRGKIIWVGASNRPDYLDDAMLRRFDRVIPILPPDQIERAAILKVLSRRLQLSYAPDVTLDTIAAKTEGLTGSALEMVVRRAAELNPDQIHQPDLQRALEDYKPNYNPEVYALQTLIALRTANFYSTIPEQLPEPYQTLMQECRAERSNAPIFRAIEKLQLQGMH